MKINRIEAAFHRQLKPEVRCRQWRDELPRACDLAVPATVANFTSIVLDAVLLCGARFLLCNCRHAQQFYGTEFLFGDGQVLVFNFSFEIKAARLNLCDGPGLDLEIDSF